MTFTSSEWEAGIAWEEYLVGVKERASLWRHHWKRGELDELSRRRLEDLPGPRRVLILTEDWCGDAIRAVPWIVKACRAAPGVEVRLVDAALHDDLMTRYVTKGGRAVPVAIVQDVDGRELGWWGPRPAQLQTLVRQRLAELGPPAEEEKGKFFAPIMRWYAKDGGKAILDELILILERGGEPR
jgi:hypothetical protein